MKREVVEIRVDDSVYVLDKGFVDMVRSRKGFFYKKLKITNEMLIAWAIEQNKIVERMDLVWQLQL